MIARTAQHLRQAALASAVTVIYLGLSGCYIYMIIYLLRNGEDLLISIVSIPCATAMIFVLFDAWSEMMKKLSNDPLPEV